MKPPRRFLTFSVLERGQSIMLRTLLTYSGPAADIMASRYNKDFLGRVFIKGARADRYRLELRLGDKVSRSRDKRMTKYGRGRVPREFADGIVTCADKLYAKYLNVVGEITTDPPKTCPNEIHRDWHPEHNSLLSPSFIPDDGHWRCEGCGWLLTSDGDRVHEKYLSALFESDRGAKKARSYRGHE